MIIRRLARCVLFFGAAAATATLGGCAVGHLLGGMMQNYEYGLLIETHPAYVGLENKTVAVVVSADLATLHENPQLALTIAANVSRGIRRNVPGTRVLPAAVVANWQFRTPHWEAMPYGELAEGLKVDRVVFIDVAEYRLHPYGNQWLWEGVCAAEIGVIERDGIDPDSYVESFSIDSLFPREKGVGRDSATRVQIETGLLAQFIEKTVWLFHKHLEPKYPDKYRAPPA